MSVQACEGIWRQNCGRYVAVMSCEPRSCGQRWTDGVVYYADNGTVTAYPEGCAVDLEQYIGPLPDNSQGDQAAKIELLRTTLTQQTAEIDRLRAEGAAENERLQADWQAEFTAAQQLRSDNDRLQAEIKRLKNKWLTEFTATQQLRSEVAQLNRLLDEERDNLLYLRVDHTALEHHCEGMKAAFLAVIKTLWEMRR